MALVEVDFMDSSQNNETQKIDEPSLGEWNDQEGQKNVTPDIAAASVTNLPEMNTTPPTQSHGELPLKKKSRPSTMNIHSRLSSKINSTRRLHENVGSSTTLTMADAKQRWKRVGRGGQPPVMTMNETGGDNLSVPKDDGQEEKKEHEMTMSSAVSPKTQTGEITNESMTGLEPRLASSGANGNKFVTLKKLPEDG